MRRNDVKHSGDNISGNPELQLFKNAYNPFVACFNRGYAYTFGGAVGPVYVRSDGNNVKLRIQGLEESAFKTCMNNGGYSFFACKFFIFIRGQFHQTAVEVRLPENVAFLMIYSGMACISNVLNFLFNLSLAIIGGISCQKFKSSDVVFEFGHAHVAGGERSYAVIKIFNDFGVQ